MRVLQEAAPLRPPRGQDGSGQQLQDDALPDGELPGGVPGGLGRRCLTGEIMDQLEDKKMLEILVPKSHHQSLWYFVFFHMQGGAVGNLAACC